MLPYSMFEQDEGYDPEVIINWICNQSTGFARDDTEIRDMSMAQLAQAVSG